MRSRSSAKANASASVDMISRRIRSASSTISARARSRSRSNPAATAFVTSCSLRAPHAPQRNAIHQCSSSRASHHTGWTASCPQPGQRSRRPPRRARPARRVSSERNLENIGPKQTASPRQASRVEGLGASPRRAKPLRQTTKPLDFQRFRLRSGRLDLNQCDGTPPSASALGTGSTRRCAGTGSFPYGASAWRRGQLALGGPDR